MKLVKPLSCHVSWGITGSYVDYTGTSTSNKSDANMEHSDSQGSNDTIKITPQFPPHFKPKVKQFVIVMRTIFSVIMDIDRSYNRKKILSRQASGGPWLSPGFGPDPSLHVTPSVSAFPVSLLWLSNNKCINTTKIFCSESFLMFLQGDPLRTLPLSRGGSVESLPSRTQCMASSDSKRMSADLSELEPKMPFTPSGNSRHYTAQSDTWKQNSYLSRKTPPLTPQSDSYSRAFITWRLILVPLWAHLDASDHWGPSDHLSSF